MPIYDEKELILGLIDSTLIKTGYKYKKKVGYESRM
jgi:hypothetical protein